MEDYWHSPEAMERKRLDRWLQTARAIAQQEPRQKGPAGRRAARPFREEVRKAIVHSPNWPKPRAALALDLHLTATDPQPPALWRLPKYYLDLLGATTAPIDDPGPVLFRDDAQVKLLFASLTRSSNPEGRGAIHLEARTRASAVIDMEHAGDLLDHDDDELDDTRWGEADPWDDLEYGTVNQCLPADLNERLRLQDKSRYQAMLLGSNDRLLRAVFFQAARWLLTGADSDIERLRRLGLTGSPAVDEIIDRMARTNAESRELLWSALRIELPSLPLRHGDGARFDEGVRQAMRNFVEERPDLQPLLVPLRVTVLVIPPKRPKRRGRKVKDLDVKDLDNILIKVLTILEDELEPHAEPWLLLPDVSVEGVSPDPDRPQRLARYRSFTGSKTWAYQVFELHRGPSDSDQGSLIVIPGLGWNRKSIWEEAEGLVEQRLQKLVDK